MKRDFLKGFGLDEEQITQILNQAGKELVSKEQEFEAKLVKQSEEFESLKNELGIANSTISELKKSNKDNEGLQAKIEQFQEQIKAEREQSAKNILQRSMDYELKMAGCIDPLCVMPLIDMDKVEMTKDGTIVGFQEQIKALSNDGIHNILFGGSETAPEPEQSSTPERGGYDPARGENISTGTDDVASNQIGLLLAKERVAAKETETNVSSYWDSVKP